MASNLTISQSLRRISFLKGKLNELSGRAAASVSYVAGKKEPTFDFDETRDALEKAREELLQLEASVARANAMTRIDWKDRKVTLAEAIRRLQEFKGQIAWFNGLPIREGSEESTEPVYDELTGRHIRQKVTTVYVTKLTERQHVAEVDRLKDEFQALNTLVEAANHRTEVDWCQPESVATS